MNGLEVFRRTGLTSHFKEETRPRRQGRAGKRRGEEQILDTLKDCDQIPKTMKTVAETEAGSSVQAFLLDGGPEFLVLCKP